MFKEAVSMYQPLADELRPAELDEVYGIGPVLAERILQYRRENGAFTSVEELLEVEGIGPSVLEEIVDLITVEEDQG